MAKKKSKGFSKRERFIFTFWDGEKNRKVDPLEVQQRLVSNTELDLEIDLKIIQTSAPNAPEALTRLCSGVRSAFKVKEFDDGGLLQAECLALLIAYSMYMSDLKKKLPSSLTSQKPTEFPTDSDTKST
jgi:hypothetical protein